MWGDIQRIMRLAVITVVRDERDIIALFLAHVTRLFDLVFIVDHRSVDGTNLALDLWSKKENFYRYTLNTSSHHQSQVSHRLVKEAFSKGADFVFFLDADEFVNVQSRAELEEALGSQTSPLLELRWKNTIIEGFLKEANPLSPESVISVPVNRTSKVGKAIISKRFYDDTDEYELSLGNHAIKDGAGNAIPAPIIGDILHVPIRSRGQFARKLIRSSLNKISQLTLKYIETWHYQLPLKMFSESDLSDEQMYFLAANYSGTWFIGELKEENISSPAFERKSFNNIVLQRETYEELNAVMNHSSLLTDTQLFASYVSSFRLEAPTYYRFEINGENICAIRNDLLNASGEEDDLKGILTAENERLLIENQTVHRQSKQIQEGFTELRNEITSLQAILQNERTNGQAEMGRLESKLEELKQQQLEDSKTVQILQGEVELRGSVLDKKRTELAQARTDILKYQQQLAEKEQLLEILEEKRPV
jgi:Glycosyl transferase family 2